jgi:tRNA dimethylallyltransferase
MTKPKIIAIGGPTASGKTGISIDIARKFNGEIINIDSRQIYKHLNIGTAKEKISERFDDYVVIQDIPHYLIDFLEPNQDFDLARFQKLAFDVIDKILSKDKLPILVGGTGLYLDSVIYNYNLEEKNHDPIKRSQLSKLTLSQLQQKLPGNIFDKMTPSDQKNPHRLIRKIEKLENKTAPMPENRNPKYDYLYLAVKSENIEENIDKRVAKMFKDGLIEENIKLREMGYTTKLNSLKSIGYQEFDKYLEGNKNLEEAKDLIKLHTRQYAKRQMTWFKRNKEIVWVNNLQEADDEVKKFIQL